MLNFLWNSLCLVALKIGASSHITGNIFFWCLTEGAELVSDDNSSILNIHILLFLLRTEKKTDDFSAIIFHHRSIKLSDLPEKRDENQLYIYFNLESQARFIRPDLKSLKNFFNLSMTFRLNADIPYFYGEFVQVADHPSPGHDLDMIINNFGAANTQLAEKKKGESENGTLVAQFVSHCQTPSRREKVISKLSKLINIDIYGGCGPLKCSRKPKDHSCYDAMNQTYKFYLSFENSLCKV